MKAVVRTLILAAAFAGCTLGGFLSIRLAIADYWFRQETPESTQKAIDLSPDQAGYRVRLALLVGDEKPSVALAALRRAVELNPNDGRAWIELGLRYEADGRLADAENTLLRAAEVDKTYVPRWTLMNYYFRRNQAQPFWYWAKAAAPMIYGDAGPLFHLCGRVAEDGQLIERLGIRKSEVQAAYVYYLLDTGRADLAGEASRRLMDLNRPGDVALLLNACDREIEARRVDAAAAIWNGLLAKQRLPFGAGEDGRLLTNGDFAVSPTGHGFDWRIPVVDGVSAAREDDPVGLRLTFSGRQPEQADVLTQFVAVTADTDYDFSFRYRTQGIESDTGLAWQVVEAGEERAFQTGEDLASNGQVERHIRFMTPRDCRLVRVTLHYGRRRGTTRIAGWVVVRGAGMSVVGR